MPLRISRIGAPTARCPPSSARARTGATCIHARRQGRPDRQPSCLRPAAPRAGPLANRHRNGHRVRNRPPRSSVAAQVLPSVAGHQKYCPAPSAVPAARHLVVSARMAPTGNSTAPAENHEPPVPCPRRRMYGRRSLQGWSRNPRLPSAKPPSARPPFRPPPHHSYRAAGPEKRNPPVRER